MFPDSAKRKDSDGDDDADAEDDEFRLNFADRFKLQLGWQKKSIDDT